MPSKSKAQQRFFGMVDAYKKGEMKNPSKKIKKAAKSMSMGDVKDFAETKHKGLPNRVEESVIKLTEQDIRLMVKEAVNVILNERDIDDDNYYGGGLSSKYFQDEEPNEMDDFEGQPAWEAIDAVLSQQGLNDIDFNEQLASIKQMAVPLHKLDKCMEMAVREIYRNQDGKQGNVSQDDVIKFVRESLPNYYMLLYKIKKLWIDYKWLVEKY